MKPQPYRRGVGRAWPVVSGGWWQAAPGVSGSGAAEAASVSELLNIRELVDTNHAPDVH